MKNLLKSNKFGPVALAVLAAISLTSPITSYAQGEERTVVRLNIDGNIEIPEWRVDSREYTDWQNSGSPFDCGNWSPATSTIDWGDNFQQLRTCEQEQVRTVSPILYNRILDEYKNAAPYEESQSITVSQYQPNVGTRDFITGEQPEPWSTWSDTGVRYECSFWSPTPDTINLYESFVQQRDCSQDQIRSRTVFDLWASGKETTNRTETEEQIVTETEIRNSTGTKDYIEGERVGNWTPWDNIGSSYDCKNWSPTANTVNEGESFTQTRSCEQKQSSTRSIYDVWRSGNEVLSRTDNKERVTSVDESRQRIGTKEIDEIIQTTYKERVSYQSFDSCRNWNGISRDFSWTSGGVTYRSTMEPSHSECDATKIIEEKRVYKWTSGKITESEYDTKNSYRTRVRQDCSRNIDWEPRYSYGHKICDDYYEISQW